MWRVEAHAHKRSDEVASGGRPRVDSMRRHNSSRLEFRGTAFSAARKLLRNERWAVALLVGAAVTDFGNSPCGAVVRAEGCARRGGARAHYNTL